MRFNNLHGRKTLSLEEIGYTAHRNYHRGGREGPGSEKIGKIRVIGAAASCFSLTPGEDDRATANRKPRNYEIH